MTWMGSVEQSRAIWSLPGFWAEFVTPEIHGDSARIDLFTGCGVGAVGLSQEHEFVLKTDGGGVWEVVSRRLLFTT